MSILSSTSITKVETIANDNQIPTVIESSTQQLSYSELPSINSANEDSGATRNKDMNENDALEAARVREREKRDMEKKRRSARFVLTMGSVGECGSDKSEYTGKLKIDESVDNQTLESVDNQTLAFQSLVLQPSVVREIGALPYEFESTSSSIAHVDSLQAENAALKSNLDAQVQGITARSRFLEYSRLNALSDEDLEREKRDCVDLANSTMAFPTRHLLCLAIIKSKFRDGPNLQQQTAKFNREKPTTPSILSSRSSSQYIPPPPPPPPPAKDLVRQFSFEGVPKSVMGKQKDFKPSSRFGHTSLNRESPPLRGNSYSLTTAAVGFHRTRLSQTSADSTQLGKLLQKKRPSGFSEGNISPSATMTSPIPNTSAISLNNSTHHLDSRESGKASAVWKRVMFMSDGYDGKASGEEGEGRERIGGGGAASGGSEGGGKREHQSILKPISLFSNPLSKTIAPVHEEFHGSLKQTMSLRVKNEMKRQSISVYKKGGKSHRK